MNRLDMSEGEAYLRIAAARLVRRFPNLVGRIERGDIHLSALVLLRDHLTEENFDELILAASRRSKRKVQELLAARFPKPDVAPTIRKLPCTVSNANAISNAAIATAIPTPTLPAISLATAAARAVSPPHETSLPFQLGVSAPLPMSMPQVSPSAPVESVSAALVAANHGRSVRNGSRLAAPNVGAQKLEPLSEDRHRVQLTVSTAVRKKLERAMDLMRHRSPHRDLAVVVERAVDLLLADLEKDIFAKTSRPQKRARSAKPEHVTRETRREVFKRDGEQCTFVSDDGHRCPSRSLLEIDHVHPRALGGTSTIENLRVRCRAHNLLAAEQAFGREHVARQIHLRQHMSRAQHALQHTSSTTEHTETVSPRSPPPPRRRTQRRDEEESQSERESKRFLAPTRSTTLR